MNTKRGKKKRGNIEDLLHENEINEWSHVKSLDFDEWVHNFLDDCELRSLAFRIWRWHKENC